jgi:hypothetical protein
MAGVTQAEAILNHLLRRGSITPLEALAHHGCMRLAARVHDLRNRGHAIRMEMIPTRNGKHVACYRMEKRKCK